MPRHPKRFYKKVVLAPEAQAYRILLDGEPVKSPARKDVLIPSRALAEGIAEEWRAQKDLIVADAMPLTRLVFTAIDRVGPHRAAVIDQITAYGASDLLCYRASPSSELARRQKEHWDPLLLWAADRLGIVLTVGEGLAHIAQPEGSLQRLRERLEGYDVFVVASLHSVASITGSAILALAVAEARASAREAFAAAQLDETYQAEVWGEDAEAKDAADRKRAELEIVEHALELMRGTRP